MQTVFRRLFSFDLFSIKPSDRITFEGQKEYSTFLGKIFSWLFIGLSLGIFINFGSNMFFHLNPQSMISQNVSQDPPYNNLNTKEFFIGFGLQDLRNNSKHYIDETIYTVKMIQRVKVGTNITLYPIPIQRCSLDMVPDIENLRDYYFRNQISNLYCPSLDSLNEYALQSTWDGPVYKNVLINIYPCVNSSSNGNSCKSPEKIVAALNNGNYAMHFTTLTVDPNNYNKPTTIFGKDIYTPISASTLTYIEMNFEHLYLSTDKGFLFKEIEELHYVSYLSNRQVLSFRSDMTVQIDMKLDKVITTYIRNYDKIQNVLANIGGFLKALMIIANFLLQPFINLNFKLTLANENFHFKTKKINKQNSKIGAKIGNNFVKNCATIDTRLPISDSKRVFSPPVLQTDKLKMSYFQYYFSCCRDNLAKQYKMLLKKGLDQIDHVMNISYIMRKLIEIDMLKVVLLDANQLAVFNNIPKPTISLAEKNEKEKTLKLHQLLSQSIHEKELFPEKVLDAYNTISSKTLKSKKDEKLLEMMPSASKMKLIKVKKLDKTKIFGKPKK